MTALCTPVWAQAPSAATAPNNTATELAQLPVVEIAVRRENRVSKGATNLNMEIKDTPQSISTVERQSMSDLALATTNEALKYGVGLSVDEIETNRTSYSSRGFEVNLTQIDGMGVSNSWGLVTGHQDAYLFEKVEIVRGANGLLTGVGNASGTINYVRKRPTNQDGGEVFAGIGSRIEARGTGLQQNLGRYRQMGHAHRGRE